MIQLYDYQSKYIESLRGSIKRGNKRLVLCASTGAGKTVMFSYMVSEHLKKGGRAIIFTHRSELLTQANGTFSHFGIEADVITANSNPDLSKNCHVAMVETFNKRKDEYLSFLQSRTLVIFDEAHLQNFTKIMPLIHENSIVIGATATPYRKPKENQMSDFYNDLVHEIDTPELIEIGKLNPAKSFGIPIDLSGLKKSGEDYDTASYYSENQLYRGVVSNWKKHAWFTKTILFASNIESSKEVCAEFVLNGFDAKHVDGSMSKSERFEIFEWFNKTPSAILCNCGIATAGFDQHDIQTVILYRATTSLPLFLQMCGRGSRLSPQTGKTHFNILDFGNNISRHGFWEEPREWKLKYEKKSTREQASPVKDCPKCGAMNYASAKICQICEFEFPKTEKEQREEIELQELHRITTSGRKISQLSVNELIILQRSKILKPAFVWRVLRWMGMEYVRYYADCMNYSNGWIYRQEQELNDCEFRDYEIRK